MKIDELIIELARDAGPVAVLPRPSVRLVRWTGVALPIAAAGILIIGPRADVMNVVRQPAYAVFAGVMLLTALLSAGAAFVLSVPGAERSRLQRVVPFAVGCMWAVGLLVLLRAGGDPLRRLAALPVHAACVAEIAVFGFVAGWALLGMLQRAAPLQATWTATLAALAATALGAFGAHIICPIDDPAHHLAGHLVPVVLLILAGAVAGRRSLRYASLA